MYLRNPSPKRWTTSSQQSRSSISNQRRRALQRNLILSVTGCARRLPPVRGLRSAVQTLPPDLCSTNGDPRVPQTNLPMRTETCWQEIDDN
jgi:hypothetical protein